MRILKAVVGEYRHNWVNRKVSEVKVVQWLAETLVRYLVTEEKKKRKELKREKRGPAAIRPRKKRKKK